MLRRCGEKAGLPHAAAGKVSLVASPMRFSATPIRHEIPPPVLGQHSEEILRGILNKSDAEIVGLMRALEIDIAVDLAGCERHQEFAFFVPRLVKIVDLGDWWEHDTGLPVPLAGICARADLDAEIRTEAERAIRASVEYAFAHPDASRAYVRQHDQEMSDAVCDKHIALYVNRHSLDLGDDGLQAVHRLVAPPSAGAR